jgi:hypothetical protein
VVMLCRNKSLGDSRGLLEKGLLVTYITVVENDIESVL